MSRVKDDLLLRVALERHQYTARDAEQATADDEA